jgi:hypothetical protein
MFPGTTPASNGALLLYLLLVCFSFALALFYTISFVGFIFLPAGWL